MEFPVTIDTLRDACRDAVYADIPEDQEEFWKNFASLLNFAYGKGYEAGSKK